MPMKVTDAEGKEIEVPTQDEIAAQVEAAKTQAAKDAAEAAAKETEARLLSDPNGLAAKGRRDAEKKAKDAQKEVERLTGELDAAKAANNTGEIEKLKTDLETANQAKAASDTAAAELKADYDRQISYVSKHGVNPEKLKAFEAMLTATGVDPKDGDAVAKALDGIKADAPGLFINATEPYAPSSGARTTPPKQTLTLEEAERLSNHEYAKRYKETGGRITS